MGHNLNFNQEQKRYAMYSLKELPWHSLGQVVQEALTSQEVMETSCLNFLVKKGEAYLKYDNEIIANTKGPLIPNTFFTYREDTGEPLCANGRAVTKQYKIIQNIEAFSFFDSIVGDGQAIYETAGALGKGEMVFVTAKLDKSLFANSNDQRIDQYLLMYLNHDGSSSVIVKFTPIRVVCNNTLDAALGGRGEIRIRHSASYKDKLEAAKLTLGLIDNSSVSLVNTIEALNDRKIVDYQVDNLVAYTFLNRAEMQLVKEGNLKEISSRKLNIIQDVVDYYHYGIGQKGLDNSLYKFTNAVSGYFQNSKQFTTNGKTDNRKKFDNILFGTANDYNRKAFDIARKVMSDSITI